MLLAVRALAARPTPAPATPEIVVVDNGSRDGSVDAVRREHPDDVVVVVPDANLGYAAAANRGTAATTAPVVVVCNADLEVRAGSAAAVLAAVRRPSPISPRSGPCVRNPDGSRYPSARRARPSLVDARGPRAARTVWPRNPFTRRYRHLDADWTGPATSTGCRVRRSACAAPRSTRWAGGTSATSCTWRTSTCVGACAGSAGGSPTSPPVRCSTCRGPAPPGARTG